jgi:hypothetical protein
VKPLSAREQILHIVDTRCRDFTRYKTLEEIPILLDEVEREAHFVAPSFGDQGFYCLPRQRLPVA